MPTFLGKVILGESYPLGATGAESAASNSPSEADEQMGWYMGRVS